MGIQPTSNKQGRWVLKRAKDKIVDFIEGGRLLEEDFKVGIGQSVLEGFDARKQE